MHSRVLRPSPQSLWRSAFRACRTSRSGAPAGASGHPRSKLLPKERPNGQPRRSRPRSPCRAVPSERTAPGPSRRASRCEFRPPRKVLMKSRSHWPRVDLISNAPLSYRLQAASMEGSLEAKRGRDWLARKLRPLKSIRRRDVSWWTHPMCTSGKPVAAVHEVSASVTPTRRRRRGCRQHSDTRSSCELHEGEFHRACRGRVRCSSRAIPPESSGRYFLMALPRFVMASPTFRPALPSPSWTAPSAR